MLKIRSKQKINTSLQLSLSANGRTIEIPEGGVPVYSCRFQTAILVDGKQTETNCGEPGSLPGVEQENDSESDTSKETETPTDIPITSPTVTPTDTPTNTPTDTPACPTAVADASPRSGEAPLEVDFDGSGSSDPNNDIEQYIWRFKDGSPPARGKTVTHTFRTAGTYYVELVVVDSQGCRDTDIVEITVESRVG